MKEPNLKGVGFLSGQTIYKSDNVKRNVENCLL